MGTNVSDNYAQRDQYAASGWRAHLWLGPLAHFAENAEQEFEVLRPLVRKESLHNDLGVVFLVDDDD